MDTNVLSLLALVGMVLAAIYFFAAGVEFGIRQTTGLSLYEYVKKLTAERRERKR